MKFHIPQSEPISERFSLLVHRLAGINTEEPGWQKQLNCWISQNQLKWWRGLWVTCEVKGDPGPVPSDTNAPLLCATDAFPEARISIAENILIFGPHSNKMLTCWAEDGPRTMWSRSRLKEKAGRFASAFYALGLQPGDNIVIQLPDVAEKVAAFLGAAWMGLVSIIEPPWAEHTADRKGGWAEFNPKMIVTCDGFRRNGKWIDQGDFLEELGTHADDDLLVVAVPCAGSRRDLDTICGLMPWKKFEGLGQGGGRSFGYVPFDHPLAHVYQLDGSGYRILGSGEWLLSVLPNWLLAAKIGAGGHVFVADTQDQNEWLRAVAALATGSDLVLYDGVPEAMNDQVLWRIVEREQVHVLSLSASTMARLRAGGETPLQDHQTDAVELLMVDETVAIEDEAYLIDHCFANARIIR